MEKYVTINQTLGSPQIINSKPNNGVIVINSILMGKYSKTLHDNIREKYTMIH